MSQKLTQSEKAEIQQATASLMQQDAQHANDPYSTFVPNIVKSVVPASAWSSLSRKEKAEAIQIFLKAEIICSCPKRGRAIQAAMHKAMHGDDFGGESLGLPSWERVSSEAGMRRAMFDGRAESTTDTNGFPVGFHIVIGSNAFHFPNRPNMNDTLTLRELSRLVWCFQEYACASDVSARQSAPLYPQLRTSSPAGNYFGATGVLDTPTKKWLCNLVESRFAKVDGRAAPLNLIGQLLGLAIVSNVAWRELNNLLFSMQPNYTYPELSVNAKQNMSINIWRSRNATEAATAQDFLILRSRQEIPDSDGNVGSRSWNPLAYLQLPPDGDNGIVTRLNRAARLN